MNKGAKGFKQYSTVNKSMKDQRTKGEAENKSTQSTQETKLMKEREVYQ